MRRVTHYVWPERGLLVALFHGYSRLVKFSSVSAYLAAALMFLLPLNSLAQPQQIQPPREDQLFSEDVKTEKQRMERQQEAVLKGGQPRGEDLKFEAPELEYDKEKKEMRGRGDVMLSYQGITVQAEEGSVNTETKDAHVQGNMLFSWPEGSISGREAWLNLESETGEFRGAEAIMEEGQYRISASTLNKVSEFDYRFNDAVMTTCHCPDGSCPWSLRSKELEAEEEGYAVARNASLNLFGVPVLYTPWFMFPVKVERQSGLLAPTYGYSSRDGFELELPLFVVLDEQSDVLVSPFIESRTRRGSGLDFRKAFSEDSELESHFVYSDESPRDGDLRGTVTTNVYDPSIDENRFGAYVGQSWRTERDVTLPTDVMTDIHYVSDNLFLREMDDDQIGLYNQRYATSRIVGRSSYSDFLSGEMMGEYNQSMETDTDLVFQRLPDTRLAATKSVRPFGYNRYGVKLVTGASAAYTQFARQVGYDGARTDLSPTMKIPYHYRNYFNGDFTAGLHHTTYMMQNTDDPDNEGQTVDDGERTVPNFNYTVTTGVERVYELPEDSLWTRISGLGYENRGVRLRRVKHTIEPIARYSYVPETFQDDLPLYDSLDRIRHKSLVLYGIKTDLLGRFLPTSVAGDEVAELSPEVEDLPMIDTEQPLSDLDLPGTLSSGRTGIRRGEIRNMASLFVRQTYDYVQAQADDPNVDEFSDISSDLLITPAPYFGVSFGSNYDAQGGDFSSYNIGAHVLDDRGDALRARYSNIPDTLGQWEGNLELVLTDRYKLGYYGRFDDIESEFLETAAALRIVSACNCWNLDLGYRERLNPDKSAVMLTFTFRGLGDITQDFSFGEKNQ